MRFTRNFIIILSAAAAIILVSTLLISHVNKALGYFIIPLLVVFVVVPLSQRLRRPGKLFTKDDLKDDSIGIISIIIPILIAFGSAWGLSTIVEHWYKGWGWIGWTTGMVLGPVVVIGAWVLYSSRIFGPNPRAIERRKLIICDKVMRTRGISYTALCQSVKFDHYEVNRLVRKLLKENRLRCEQRGRVRRYFSQHDGTISTSEDKEW